MTRTACTTIRCRRRYTCAPSMSMSMDVRFARRVAAIAGRCTTNTHRIHRAEPVDSRTGAIALSARRRRSGWARRRHAARGDLYQSASWPLSIPRCCRQPGRGLERTGCGDGDPDSTAVLSDELVPGLERARRGRTALAHLPAPFARHGDTPAGAAGGAPYQARTDRARAARIGATLAFRNGVATATDVELQVPGNIAYRPAVAGWRRWFGRMGRQR